jgi:HSP20 family protein
LSAFNFLGKVFLMPRHSKLSFHGDFVSKPKNNNQEKSEVEEAASNAVTPEVCFDHDDHTYFIDVELPGVKKEQIDLSIGEQSLCIEAARSDGELVYIGCFALVHPVDESKTKAKYENGLLQITVPFKTPIKGIRIQVE